MKIIKLLFITLVLASLLYSCNKNSNYDRYSKHDKHLWQGMLSYMDKDYSTALTSFTNAFEIIDNDQSDNYFYAAAAALHLDQHAKAKSLIIDAIKKTNADESYFGYFEEFDQFRKLDLFQEITDNYAEYAKSFLDNLEHPEIYQEVKNLLSADQMVREGHDDKEMIKIDSLNIVRLIEITEKYGWQKNCWMLLWHQRGNVDSDNYVWSYFRPKINELIEKGEIRKDFWALFEDFDAMFSEGNQIYGTMWSNFDSHPVKDVANVDRLRDSVGLPPLWYLHKVYGSNLPDGYVYKEEGIR